MKNKKQLGIYIHIPFCVQKCVYCDFLSAPADTAAQAEYMCALLEEIRYTAHRYKEIVNEYETASVFFGGGTPSAVKPQWIAEVMTLLQEHFNVSEEAEVSIECNPGTLDWEKARIYSGCGINRISFGLQAADNETLRLLGRIHTFEMFQESMEIARAAGFDNVNVDVMSALPGQTFQGYQQGLEKILSLEPEHISAYSLILEEGTPLYEQIENYPPLPEEETERQMYYVTQELLAGREYHQYEISNFARAGFECRHNLSYWERRDYLGFGLGAASLFQECRWANCRGLKQYTTQIHQAASGHLQIPRAEFHRLTRRECMEEFMFLGLRKTAGISPEEFAAQFGCTVFSVYGPVIERNIGLGLLKQQAGRLCLTPRGVDISNRVLSEFLLD